MASSSDSPITLDQIEVFLCVIREGSFSKAARRLRRVQSAVSYTIGNLERFLEVELFDRSGRTPVLTEAGRALAADARAVSEHVDRLRARARTLASGIEPRVSIAVDMLFPMPALLDGLQDFSRRFESVDLHLRTEALGAVAQLVADGVCLLGIGVEVESMPRGLIARPLTRVDMVPVCGAGHPLGDAEVALLPRQLRSEIQIVVTDRSDLTEGRDRAVLSDRTWRVADLASKAEMLRRGFGWGLMPAHLVARDLARGALRRLCIDGWEAGGQGVVLHVIHRAAEPPGPAARWLLERLEAGCAGPQ